MAVISVKEDYSFLNAHEEAVISANERPKITLETSRAFDVEFDNSDVPSVRPLMARLANDAWTAVPAIFAVHPYDSWLFVKSKDVDVIGPFHFKVIAKYGCYLDSTTQEPLDPLLQPPEISFTHAGSNEPVDTDSEGLPTTNSAGESFDPPITNDYADLVIRISRNERTFDKLVAADYKNAVNSDVFLGYPAGHVKCTMYEADEMQAATLIYYRVRYEFRIRYDEVKTRDGVGGTIQTQVFGWIKRVRDEGFRELDGENADGSPKYKPITDEDNVRLSQPHLLDGSGHKLSDDVINNPPLPEACFLKFDLNKKRPFSIFGL